MFGFLQKMLDALTSAYNRLAYSNIGKLFSIFAGGLEDIHKANKKVLDYRDIDKATGYALDKWGKNVGVSREGLSDDIYRIYIKTKLPSLLSGGDIDTIINATATIFQIDPSDITITEGNAKIEIAIPFEAIDDLTNDYTSANIAKPYIKMLLSAGIGLNITITVTTDAALEYTGTALTSMTSDGMVLTAS